MSKDYVTIKIPRKTRDQARDDPRTYEAIMEAGLGEDVGDLEPFGGEVPNTSEVDAEALGKEVAKHTNTDRLYARLEELETNHKNEIEALQGGRV